MLNSLFDTDKIEIYKINKKSVLLLIIAILLIIFLLLCIKKNNYYSNEIIVNDDNVFLLVDKDYINSIKNKKKVIIDSKENDYSINKIIPVDDNYMVNIKLNGKKINIKTGKYKILLGKESLFEFIFRIIQK